MSERIVVITGASSGIGEATARLFSKENDKVILGARRIEKLTTLANEIGADYHALDVSSEESIHEFFNYVIDKYQRIDILFNNAGVMLLSSVDEKKQNEWNSMIDTNLKGVINCTGAVIDIMEKQKQGMIINTCSTAGYRVMANSSIYSATKFGIRAFSDGLRKEVSNKGIRVCLVSPGPTKTELVSHISGEFLKQQTERFTSEGLEAIDVAECVVFVANQPLRASIDELIISPTHKI